MMIIDNALPISVFENIKEQVFHRSFPWYFTFTTNHSSSESIYGNSFCHIPIADGNIETNIGYVCRTCLLIIADKLNFKIGKIHRARFGLLEPKPQGKYINVPHIDYEMKHFTALLYLNNSDGETIIYNEKYNINSNTDGVNYYDEILKKTVTIKTKIECKENRFIMFDGFHYHSSTCPTNVNRRIVLNFNFEIE